MCRWRATRRSACSTTSRSGPTSGRSSRYRRRTRSSSRAMASGVKIGIDTDELVQFSKRAAKAAQLTTPTIIVGLNEVGDGLVSLMARSLSNDTGLALEQVRALMKIERATPSRLSYEVS